MTVGRITTALLVILGLLWIPFMDYISPQLYVYLQSVQGYIAPPIAACFLLGLFFTRLNGPGAFSTLMGGFVLGALRLILEIWNGPNKNALAEGSFWEWYAEINFLHFAFFLFLFCVGLLVIISLATKPPTPKSIKGLTWSWVKEKEPKKEQAYLESSPKRKKINKWLSYILILILIILWIIFA